MTEIKPVTVPTKGTGIYFNLLALNFPMDPTSVGFYWSVFNEIIDQESQPMPGVLVLEGNLTMDAETYAGWGTDDNYAINWALGELGFERA